MGSGRLWQGCLLGLLSWLPATEALSVQQRSSDTMQAIKDSPARRGSTMPTSPAVLYFLHTPKVAGASFTKDARDMLGNSIMAYLSKEGCYEWADSVPDAGVVTLLRDPRAHVLSQYSHCASAKERAAKWKEGMPPFADWVKQWAELREQGKADADFTPWQVPKGKRVEVSETHSRTPFKCYSPVNMQTHRLACKTPYNYKTGLTTKSSTAIKNMRNAWMVGIMEAYPESMCLLYEKVHRELPASCNCLASEDGRGNPPGEIRHLTHGVRLHSVEDEPEDVLKVVDQLTDADRQLYHEGVRRFVSEMRAAEAKHGMQVLCNATLGKLHPYMD